MKVKNLREICGGCPTIYEWEDSKGIPHSFYLRHGVAIIEKEGIEEALLSDAMPGHDGVCSFDDVVEWARARGLRLKRLPTPRRPPSAA